MELFTNGSIKTNSPRFTHLKVYSSYSLGVGLNTPAEICAQAARLGYSSVALTDVGGTYGYIEFHQGARQHGLKPIYGTVVQHYPLGGRSDERFDLTLLAMSREGLRHIAALSSFAAAATETQTALDIEIFALHSTGVVAFMGAVESEIAGLLAHDDEDGARRVVGAFREIFGDRLFVEVQDHGASGERDLARKLLRLAGETHTAPLLTQEVRYVERGLKELYGTLRGIHDPAEERDFFRIGRQADADWSMKSPLEMSQLRPFYEAAFDNARRVDEMVPGDLMDHADEEWPDEKRDRREELHKEILDLCSAALQGSDAAARNVGGVPYGALLEREIDEAVAEGLGPTLLLFHRVLRRLREARVDLGPATGLSLQSLCAYLLGITSYDPYRYDLRHYPAFDSRLADTSEFELQLTGETRSEAVHALFTLFEFGEVAYLPAIERVTPAKAIRMAGSVVSVPEAEAREIQDAVARQPGVPIEGLYEQNESLGRLYRRSLAARDLLRRAALLEDLPIGIIRSRRSLAVSPVPLTQYVGYSIDSDTGDLFVQAGRDNFPVANVFRVDVTSLGALSVAVEADHELRRTGLADYGWGGIPLDDPEVWRRIQGGDTTGVFLFEGDATLQRRGTFELQSIDDLTNFLALMRLRDGEQSLARRFEEFQAGGGDVIGNDDEITDIVRSTRGHILYDEQTRDIISALTGKSPFEAWKMIHDLRSSSPGTLSSVRTQFMMGAAEKNISVEMANQWFERLLRHCKTTTRRQRVFADALLVYKLFLIKTRHEGAFWTALLNSSIENEGKFARYLGAVRVRGMLLDVDVNRSDALFAVEDGMVRTGFCAVRGFDAEKAERVVKSRTRGEFTSLDDFVKRVGSKHLRREDLRRLIDAGAFDSLEAGRPELLKRVSAVYGRRAARAKGDGKSQLELPLGD